VIQQRASNTSLLVIRSTRTRLRGVWKPQGCDSSAKKMNSRGDPGLPADPFTPSPFVHPRQCASSTPAPQQRLSNPNGAPAHHQRSSSTTTNRTHKHHCRYYPPAGGNVIMKKMFLGSGGSGMGGMLGRCPGAARARLGRCWSVAWVLPGRQVL
jgi:hypothetical protein